MTQKNKELLLKDLSARLPYNLLVENKFGSCIEFTFIELMLFIRDNQIVKPYLRPMSSMTENETKEFDVICDNLLANGSSEEIWNTVIDWLNSHHFDHRHLIEKGLALEAFEGMYKAE